MSGTSPASYDGVSQAELERECGVARVVLVDACTSTMDLAHDLAADGAPHGTVVVAEVQEAGRGRSGKAWSSGRGAGVWASVVLRERVAAPPGIVSLRVGLALAAALEQLVPVRIGLKWPNDVFVGAGKLAGVLAEARWRGDAPEWIVVGVGVNVAMPAWAGGAVAAALGPDATRPAVLAAICGAVLRAAAQCGAMDDAEVQAFAERDVAAGRRISAPVAGTVLGITRGGALRVQGRDGREHEAVAGSLVFDHDPAEG